jgi:hypothetical protein
VRPAPPELAARQWHERYAGAADTDSDPSLELLARALRIPRLVLMTGDPVAADRPHRLRGALAVDGLVVARAERRGAPAGEAPGLLRDLLVRGQLLEPAPPWYRRKSFWIPAGAAAAAAATAIVLFIVLEPRVETNVGF